MTKEELRGSREDLLVVLLTGSQIKESIVAADFPEMLKRVWQEACMT